MESAFLAILIFCAAIFFNVRHEEAIEKQDTRIHQLEVDLKSQMGAQLATHEFHERQAGVYLGCTAFFHTCSPETQRIGEIRVQEGYAGTTDIYYWAGKFGLLLVISLAIGIAVVVCIVVMRWTNLLIIQPKQVVLDRALDLINTFETRLAAVREEIKMENIIIHMIKVIMIFIG